MSLLRSNRKPVVWCRSKLDGAGICTIVFLETHCICDTGAGIQPAVDVRGPSQEVGSYPYNTAGIGSLGGHYRVNNIHFPILLIYIIISFTRH